MADAVPGKVSNFTNLKKSEELGGCCEICSVSGEFKDIHGYCENCEEFLCQDCFIYHVKPKSFRNHKLVHKSKISSDSLRKEKQVEVAEENTEVCEEHLKERLNFYCHFHGKFCCGTCVALGHRTCEDVEYLPSVIGDYPNSDEYKAVENELERLLIDVGNCKAQSSEKAEANERQTERVLKEIDNFREMLISEIDKREEEITTHVGEANRRNVECITNLLDTCVHIESEMCNLKQKMSSLKTEKQYCQLYILMKNATETINNFKTNLLHAENELDYENYDFMPNTSLAEMLREANNYGKLGKKDLGPSQIDGRTTTPSSGGSAENGNLKEDRRRTDCKKKCVSSSAAESRCDLNKNDVFRFKKIQPDGDINIKTLSCEKKPWVTGITNTPDNDRFIIAVYNSQQIALVDLKQNKINAAIKLHSCPWDVMSIKRGEIIATLPFNSKLVFLKISSIKGQPSGTVYMKITKQVSVNGDCHGITNNSEYIFVSYQKPAKLEILQTDGSLLKVVEFDKEGNRLLKEPQYIACNANLKLLYVTDWDCNTTTCMTTDGVVKNTLTDETLKAPTGIAIAEGGNVFVAGYHSNNVLQFSPTFRGVQLCLDQKEKVVLPQTLAFSANGNKCLISFRNSEVLKIFKVK